MVIKNWHAPKNIVSVYIATATLLLGGIILFLLAASTPTVAFEVFPNLYLVFGAMILIAIFFLYLARDAHDYRDFEFMIVGVGPEKTSKVIQNALDYKNFPYARSGTDFNLKTERLLIKVKKASFLYKNTNLPDETCIWIGPISSENFEITQSLKTNIEDGFQLKGLA